MKRINLSFLALLSLSVYSAYGQKAISKEQKEVIAGLDKKSGHYGDLSKQIWDLAEVGYKEDKSAAILEGELEKEGFTLEKGVAGIPTAFVASYGSGKPVISILASSALASGRPEFRQSQLISGQYFR
jgi:aminobenzoyl-glutamate utilization protein B